VIRVIVNMGVFQAGWFLSVLCGNPAALAFALLASILYARYFYEGMRDLILFAAVLLLGFSGDSLLGMAGVLVHPSGLPFPPVWMMVLWLLFAMTLPWSLRPLMQRRGLFLGLCMVGGTLSYIAGTRLTTVTFGYTLPVSAGLLCVAWLLHGAIILALMRRWERAGV
jgi:hypothetical protein